MVRGALFNSLEAMGADFSRVLDLYAGTGALGIEALSRGSQHCDFVERERSMAPVIRSNLEATGLAGHGDVHTVPAERAITRLEGPYTLVLADPPYNDETAIRVLESIAQSKLVSDDAVVVYEHGARTEPPATLGRFALIKQLRHGDSALSIYWPAANETTGGENC